MQCLRAITRNNEVSQRIIVMMRPLSNFTTIKCKDDGLSHVVENNPSLASRRSLQLSMLPVSSLLVPVRYSHKGKGKMGKGKAEKYQEDLTKKLSKNDGGANGEVNMHSKSIENSFENLVEATRKSMMGCNNNYLHKVLSYPLTAIPLALGTTENQIRQGNKSTFRNHLIEESGAAASIDDIPPDTEWVIDGMAAIRLLYPMESWGRFADAFLDLCLPPPNLNPSKLIILMDTYGQNHIKVLNCRNKSKRTERIKIDSAQQKMPSKIEWDDYLSNNDNKTELIKFLVGYYKEIIKILNLKIPFIITEGENSWLMFENNVKLLETCNHYEADTKTALYASKSNDPVVIVAKDTDILILLVYVYSILKPKVDWWMKIDSDKYININNLCDYYGEAVCNILPAFHSITGSDTTSYPYRVGKLKPFKKMIKENKMILLNTFGKSRSLFSNLDNARKFLQCVMYPGKEGESLIVTRVEMYNKQKLKSSLTLIPDPSSIEEHLKRVAYQTFIWHQCMNQNIDYPSVVGCGWTMTHNTHVEVLWFNGCQAPS